MQYYRDNKRKKRIISCVRGILLVIIMGVSVVVGCGCAYLLFSVNKEQDYYSNNKVYPNEGFEHGILSGNQINNEAENAFFETPPVDERNVVVIDAGHGGNDQGTSSSKYLEKDINLTIALKIKYLLEQNDIKVILTRETDVKLSLEERAEIANENNADLFVSIHCNYYEGEGTVSGLECYYHPDSLEGKNLAEHMIENISESNIINTRGVRAEDFSVLRNTKMPAVLIEIGFMSDELELVKLVDPTYQEHLAVKIAEGIIEELK